MAIQVYMNFDGNCSEAVKFYAEVFKTEEPQIMLFGDMPSNENFPLSDDAKNRVMHAEIKIKDSTIMFSDTAPGMHFVVGNNINIMYGSNDMEEIKSIYQQLKAGGTVIMELGETFWSKCYGNVIDKFGIGWQLNYDTPHSM